MKHFFPIRMEYTDNFAKRRKTLAQTRSFSTRFYYFVKRMLLANTEKPTVG